MDKQALIRLLGSGNTPAITVFGDFCLDKYLYIDAARDELSVETDLVAYQVTHQKMYAGAGGTITNNLRALGAQVYCVGILGDDGEGMELKRRLEAVGADTRYMVQTDQRQTCTYIKPMRRENGRETELNRLDIRNFTKTPRFLEDALLENLGKALAHSQAVIICDQFMEEDMAAVTGYVRDAIGKLAESYPEKQWYADSRGHIHQFHNVIVKCNHQEIAAIFGEPAEGMYYERAGQRAGRLFAANHKPVVVTMGDGYLRGGGRLQRGHGIRPHQGRQPGPGGPVGQRLLQHRHQADRRYGHRQAGRRPGKIGSVFIRRKFHESPSIVDYRPGGYGDPGGGAAGSQV